MLVNNINIIKMIFTVIILMSRPESRGETQEGVGARLAGQHFLSSPPDLHARSISSWWWWCWWWCWWCWCWCWYPGEATGTTSLERSLTTATCSRTSSTVRPPRCLSWWWRRCSWWSWWWFHDSQGYSEGLADNELDSEISSLFGPTGGTGEGGGREGSRLQNLHLMSPLEYAAMLKQYTEPSLGVLGQVKL